MAKSYKLDSGIYIDDNSIIHKDSNNNRKKISDYLEDRLNQTTLFTGNLSTAGNSETLSDAVSNYEKLLIVGNLDNGNAVNIAEFYPALQTKGELIINHSYRNVGYQYHYGCNFTIQNNQITITGGWALVYNGNGGIEGQFVGSNQINITKIVGYKK